jgi:uncharacterized protein DUF4160
MRPFGLMDREACRPGGWHPGFAATIFNAMPELSRFFGIIIRMVVEVGGVHHRPHFHAYYQDAVAVFGVDPVELIAGELPTRQRRLVEAWAELHQPELLDDWNRLQAGQPARPIDPLR